MATPTRIGGVGSQEFAGSQSQDTLSYTVPSTGQNRALIVISQKLGSSTKPTTATYNGVSMTKIVDLTSSQQGSGVMYYLANPATGANDIVVNWGAASTEHIIIAFTLQDIVQSSPVDVSGQNNTAGATSLSHTITTTVDNDLLITWMGNGNVSSPTPGGTQSTIANIDGTDGDAHSSDDPQTTAGNYTGSYSWTTSRPADIYITSLKYLAPTPAANKRNQLLGVGQ
jgi:hypothetical protein